MPLIGVIDPSHYERSHAKAGRLPNWLDLEEVILLSSAPNPKWSPWTYEMVVAALGEHQERGDRISTTTLTAPCPRAEVIKRKVDYIGDLDAMYAPLRGTMVHRTLEAYARDGAIAEGRFFTTIDGIVISCSPDLVTVDTIYDYKVPAEQSGVPSFAYPFRHQTDQLMTNAFILRHAESWVVDGVEDGPLPFDPREDQASHVAIVYLGPRGPKIIEYTKKQTYINPRGYEKEKRLPYVWSDDEVLNGYDEDARREGGLRAQLHIMQHALDAFPEWPAPYENPETGEVYTAEGLWGGEPGNWRCPGPPLCKIPGCLAQRYPDGLTWEKK